MPQTLVAFIILFLGAALLRASNLLDRSHAERLAALVFSISLPATILVSLDGIQFTYAAWKLPLAACFVTLVSLARSLNYVGPKLKVSLGPGPRGSVPGRRPTASVVHSSVI